MKKFLLITSLVLIALLSQSSTVNAQTTCKYETVAGRQSVEGKICTVTKVRGVDPVTKKDYGCPEANGNQLYTPIIETLKCPSGTSVTPAVPAPAITKLTDTECRKYDTNQEFCDNNRLRGCTYFTCSNQCRFEGISRESACPPASAAIPAVALVVLPETQDAIRNYCDNKIGPVDTQDTCFKGIMKCVQASNLTSCLTSDTPTVVPPVVVPPVVVPPVAKPLTDTDCRKNDSNPTSCKDGCSYHSCTNQCRLTGISTENVCNNSFRYIATVCSAPGINSQVCLEIARKISRDEGGCINLTFGTTEFNACVSAAKDYATTNTAPPPVADTPVTAPADQSVGVPQIPQLAQEAPAAPQLAKEIVRRVTEAWLQTADGEDRLKIEGGIIRFPINKVEPEVNEIRVKIVFDIPDQSGSRELLKYFRVKRTSPVTPEQVGQPAGAPAEPEADSNAYNEACWQTERNECLTGIENCGRSRTVERYTCDGNLLDQFRTKPGTEGQADDLCVAVHPTKFLRYECTGCREARRVDMYCNGKDFIAQEGIQDIEECADRCPPLPTEPCQKEDLAYYCDGDSAVYKFRDEACQIQFTTVSCTNSGQVCKLGECVAAPQSDE